MTKLNPVVVVIEDEVMLLAAITEKLKKSDMTPISCETCPQALEYLRSSTELPDAIWLDYYVKDQNGLSFMRELRNEPKWSDIPVIVVSNSASPDKVREMTELGVKKYLLKADYRLIELIDIFKTVISGEEK